MSFAGKVVVITGASSGIGAATAIRFAELGASLSLSGRNEENLKKVAGKCAAITKTQPLTIIGDLTAENTVKNIVDSTIKTFSKIDVLVNNAAVLEFGSIEATDVIQFDRIFNINVRTVYQLTYLAVPHLIESKGTIVNVSSVNGMRSFSGLLAYNMSKSAIDQFTKCTALELAPKQVRVNSVNPGVIVTALHKRGGLDDKTYQAFLEHSKQTHALGRAGRAEEVAEAIVFLAGDQSSFITGVNLPVDGGRHAMCPR